MRLLAKSMFMTNSMLLWWTLDSVPPPLVIKAESYKAAVPNRGYPGSWRAETRFSRVRVNMFLDVLF